MGRLAATSSYLATVSFGDRAAAERAAARVRRIHEHVSGTDPVTGRPYAASDPALLLWVHATLVESTMAAGAVRHAAGGRRRRPLRRGDGGRGRTGRHPGRAGPRQPRRLAGLPGLGPARAALHARGSESVAYLLDPPGLDEDIAEIWDDIRDGVPAVLPDWALEMYGYPPQR